MPRARQRVVLIGIDAAEHSVVQSMLGRGELPTLAGLLREGASGTLDSPANLYSGAVWPTFYTGQRPAWHGVYHNKLWQPSRMCCVVPDARTFTARPFWEDFGRHALRSCVVDVPLVLGPASSIGGAYLGGWATHDPEKTHSYPAGLARDLRRRHGARTMPAENFGPQSLRSLAQLNGELLRATDQLGSIGADLLAREQWDFSCIVFGASHRAGHYLWDHGEAVDGPGPNDERALERIYAATDAAIAKLLAACGEDPLVLVFSLHGMTANNGWSEVVPRMLDARRIALGEMPERKGMLYTLRRSLVTRLRPVLQHVPPALSAQLVPLWSARMFDWQRTRFFPLPMDLTAFLRINLRGRERDGIVASGAEYEALCAELEQFFGSLQDVATGQPIVSEILRLYAHTPVEAPRRAGQPDLVVRWNEMRTRDVARLRSATLPAFDCPVPGHLPSGRSGNHTSRGWFVARGPGVPAGASLGAHDILDLAPTVRALLGLEADPGLHGHCLPLQSARA